MELTVRNLSKQYGKKAALDHFSYNFTPGITAVLGSNGAGSWAYLVAALAFALAATVVLMLSQLCRQTNHAILLSAAVLLQSACLQYMGVQEVNLFSLSLLFSPLECPPWRYTAALVTILALLSSMPLFCNCCL